MYARISALLVAFALAVTSLAAAQERFGNITGKVTDQTGAVLPGVTVTVTNNETQRSTVVVTDGERRLLAAGPRAGTVYGQVRAVGFRHPGGPERHPPPRHHGHRQLEPASGRRDRDGAGPRRHAAHRRGLDHAPEEHPRRGVRSHPEGPQLPGTRHGASLGERGRARRRLPGERRIGG